MALIEARASARIVRPTSGQLASGSRDLPDRVVLGVREGHEPSDKEPVRIFLGTQPEQHRAERIFIWSIEQVRDPSRVYEIYLMKALRGFDQRGWTTGFTNYRFAIPHFAGRRGRAIYNDVDQIYLADPAELFDTPLNDHGFLAIAPKESSVMLIDCERMAKIWTLEDSRRLAKGKVLSNALSIAGCWGALAGEWNARDEDEFDPATAKCVHFTTLHTQPWGPVPSRFVYLPHPAGTVWHQLERTADEAGFQVFTRERPSAPYRALLASFRKGERSREPAIADAGVVREFLRAVGQANLRSVLDYRLGAEGDGGLESVTDLDITRSDPSILGAEPEEQARFDAVVCYQGLNVLTDDDIPWVVDELFRRARRYVIASAGTADPRRWVSHARRYRDLSWWRQQFQVAADRYPDVRWVLLGPPQTPISSAPAAVEGRRALDASTRVWVLTDERPGNATPGNWPCRRPGVGLRAQGTAFQSLVGAGQPHPLVAAAFLWIRRARRPWRGPGRTW